MPLTFPTIAERTLAEWQAAPGTNSLNKFAIRNGGKRDDEYGRIVWYFDDDTSLAVVGHGKGHQVTAELP